MQSPQVSQVLCKKRRHYTFLLLIGNDIRHALLDRLWLWKATVNFKPTFKKKQLLVWFLIFSWSFPNTVNNLFGYFPPMSSLFSCFELKWFSVFIESLLLSNDLKSPKLEIRGFHWTTMTAFAHFVLIIKSMLSETESSRIKLNQIELWKKITTTLRNQSSWGTSLPLLGRRCVTSRVTQKRCLISGSRPFLYTPQKNNNKTHHSTQSQDAAHLHTASSGLWAAGRGSSGWLTAAFSPSSPESDDPLRPDCRFLVQALRRPGRRRTARQTRSTAQHTPPEQ